MSRRKQSHPKPLKRQSEDSLQSVASHLHLPLDSFSVRDPQDDVHEFTLYTCRCLKTGATYGPYEGKVLSDGEQHSEGDSVLETKDENGDDVLFAVTDSSGGWLKLLRTAASSDEVHNATLYHNGFAAWCTIAADLESDTEVVVCHRWAGGVKSPSPGEFRRRKTSPRVPGEEERLNSDNCERKNTSICCDIMNGRRSAEPCSTPDTPLNSSPSREDGRSAEDAPAFLNGSNYAPAFPCGGVSVLNQGGPLRCEQCDAFFNSRRILDVHQMYYCQGKSSAQLVSSDTDTEEAVMMSKADTTPMVNSPGTSDNGDNSPPPKDTPPAHLDAASSPDSSSSKRRPTVPSTESSPPSRPGRLFRCPYCSYSSDKKASLTRHVRMHGGASRATEGPPLPTPPMARYCANCDIQFASYKNYQVHKEYYCNTRHVHKSVPSSSPNTTQQSHPPQQPLSTPVRPHSPRNPPTSPESGTKSNYNNMVMNQPLYAAISTSPLILVPCSYVAGAGGLSPGLVPAGNIVIPNPQASSPDPQKSVIPTYTVMPGAIETATSEESSASNNKQDIAASVSNPGAKEERSPKAAKVETPRSPECEVKKEEPDLPLDLSFRKKESGAVKQSLLAPDSALLSRSSSCEDSGVPSLPVMPLLNPDLITRDHGAVLAPPVLVKQGASKCVDCNIVFYKHENYLVHKNKYCAARSGNKDSRDSGSPEKERDGTSTPEREDAGKTNQKSPISSPRINSNRTPPVIDSDLSDSQSATPMLQYYCMACGIKYSSLDNLRAHQLYYCPKREIQPLALVPPYAGLQQHGSRTSSHHDFKCNKCKNAYPTEELLRQHPCVVQRKCPYCDVYCPTLSAAQRHLVTHTGIKSFRCSLCGYKGHTLRGMRTHIRIHLDKNNSTPEEAYILCMDEGGAEIGCAGRKSSGVRINSERIKSVISTEPPHGGDVTMPVVSPISAPPPSIIPPDVLAIKALPDDPVATGDTTHWCQICGYSSSYKGNVVRHVKLVHKDLVSTQTMSNIVNSRPNTDSLLKQVDSIEHVTRIPNQDSIMSDHHSNSSSSSVDVKPVVSNGLANSKSDSMLRLDDSSKPLMLKTEANSPPPTPAGGTNSKGVKRPLSEDGGSAFKSGPKYCKSCDISFNYLSNFLAHKKFYCTPRLTGDSQESTSVQSVVQ